MLLWVTHPFLLKLPFDFSTWIDQFPYFRILGNKQSHDFSRAIYIELISTFFKDHKVHSPKVLVPFCWSLKNLLVPIHSKLHLKSCDYLYKYGRYRDVMRKRSIRVCSENLNPDFPIEREIRKRRNPSSWWISIKKSKSGFHGFPFYRLIG